jgi:hypothetical protein
VVSGRIRPHGGEQRHGAAGAEMGDTVDEVVAHALELADTQQPRTAQRGRRPPDADRLAAREALGRGRGELALEPGDLLAEVVPGGP